MRMGICHRSRETSCHNWRRSLQCITTLFRCCYSSFSNRCIICPGTHINAGIKDSQVGFHVFSKLLKRKSPAFYPIGIVSNERAGKDLLKLGAKSDQVRVADIRSKESLTGWAVVQVSSFQSKLPAPCSIYTSSPYLPSCRRPIPLAYGSST